MATHEELSSATNTLFAALNNKGTEELAALLLEQGVLLVCPRCRWNVVAGEGHPTGCPECDWTLAEPFDGEPDAKWGMR